MTTARGWNIGWSAGRTAADFAAIATTGAKVVRHQFLIQPVSGSYMPVEPDSAWSLESLKFYAEQCRKRGMLLVLCPVLHPHPVNQHEEPMWRSDDWMSRFAALWTELALGLKLQRNVAFDLLNEPMSDRWQPFAAEVIAMIREIDPYRRIIFEPTHGALAPGFRELKPIPGIKNIAYSVHVYDPWDYVAQGVGPQPLGPKYRPGHLLEALKPVRAFQVKHQAQILVGEFSVVRWAPGREAWLAEALDLFDRWGWGWCYHAWREWHGWDAEMPADETSRTRSQAEGAFRVLTGGPSMRSTSQVTKA